MNGPGEQRGALRIMLAVLVGADLLSFFSFIGTAFESARAHGTPLHWLVELLATPAGRGAVVAIGVIGAVAFARRPGRIWEGLVALLALTALSTVHAHVYGSAWRHLYYSGACLAGWLLGLAASRRAGVADDESYARTGALALLSAAYCNAALSKLVYGGVEWLSGAPIQAIIVAQDGMVGSGLGADYRAWVVGTPTVASAFSIATMVFELGAPLMLLGGWTRIAFALGLFAMHANIYLLTPILYWESIVLLLGLGLSGDRGAAEQAAGGKTRSPRFTVAVVLLCVWALLAIRHQAHRYAAGQAAKAARQAAPPPVVPPGAGAPQVVGPFAVGDAVTETWSVDALEISDTGFIARLAGAAGQASFEVTCTVSEHRSPFDLGAAHIFYSSTLPFADLQGAGAAVRERVRSAAADGDVCERVASWRAAAQVRH